MDYPRDNVIDQIERTSAAADRGPVRVGIFDSGVGGLSVLPALRALMPSAALTYVADSGYAPYGERDDTFVVDRSERIATYLFEHARTQLLVVACNTATAAAVHRIRESWPTVPIVGVEPGIKPAVAASKLRSIGVLATPSTLRSGKFQRLLEQYGVDARVHLQPCPGLAGLIEEGDLDAVPLVSMIDDFCAPLRHARVDVVVLGCTHYAFVQHHIARALGRDVLIIDTADAVARRAASLGIPLQSASVVLGKDYEPGPSTAEAPRLRLLTTGDADRLGRVAKSLLSLDFSVDACDI